MKLLHMLEDPEVCGLLSCRDGLSSEFLDDMSIRDDVQGASKPVNVAVSMRLVMK